MNIKRLISTILILCVFTGFSGCDVNQKADVDESALTPEYPKNIGFDDYETTNEIINNNPVEQDFLDSLEKFSFNSAAKIFASKENNLKNTSYSPVSLYMALALASTGAESQTKEEMFSLLEIDGKDKDYLSIQTGNLFRRLYFNNEIGCLKLANSLWLQKDIVFKNDFTDNAISNFYSSMYNVDFHDNKTADLMSKWVSDNTNGIISPDIQIDKNQILSIFNTVYFKDQWANEINEEDTKKDKFYLDGNPDNYIECDFMGTHSNLYYKGDGFISSQLGLKNGGNMIFVLPDDGIKINDLLISSDILSVVLDYHNAQNAKVTFKIPKFSYGNKLDLKDTLISLGMKKAFEENADFSAMTENIAFISDVNQETHVAIDEKGVEAAAFTSIIYYGAGMPTEYIDITLNRPFIYFITDRNNVILFIGVVYNPAE